MLGGMSANQFHSYMYKIWTGSLIFIAACAAVSLVVGYAFGTWFGVGLFILVLLGLLDHHLSNLQRLAQWARRRDDAPAPEGHGAWRRVFHELECRARDGREERVRHTATLERFRAASEAMPDGIVYLSATDSIEWLNRRAEQHLGLSQGKDIGVPLVGIVRVPELVAYMEAEHREEPLLIQSPRKPAMRLQIQVVPFGGGQKMLISRDITQLSKLETMRQDFIANVSHELRTPLTVVGGFLETVHDGLDDLDRADIERFLQMALDQSTRMQRLIEDLLTLSALETDAPAPVEERVDVCALVRSITQEAIVLSGGKHCIEIELDERDEGDILLGSQKELHSAYANLASNAVRYTPAGGRIVIGWRRVFGGGEFSVADNGIGIDPKHITRLTERFFRVDKGRSRETGGTGLGLAIVKHIVSRHGAELHIESEPGKGSRFAVCFPESRITRRR
jgi:two-component system, OmpR family, phosphate regulon sensor histidine kinase PhoR